jgi:hypothetical protein
MGSGFIEIRKGCKVKNFGLLPNISPANVCTNIYVIYITIF